MSDDAIPAFRVVILPEPTPTQLVAILTTLRSTEPEPGEEPEPLSRWSQSARREQLHGPIDEPWGGWHR